MKFCTPFDDALGAMVKGWGRPTPAQLETHPSLCLSAIYVMTRQCLSKLNIALAIPQIP